MRHITHWHRATLVVLALAMSLALAAPAAEARSRARYKGNRGGGRVVERVVVREHRPVYVRRSSSSVGPVLGGFIGGLVVGALLSRPGQYHDGYAYEDPYCHERYASLDRYDDHCRSHRHERVAYVIETRSNRRVETCGWRDGGWHTGYRSSGGGSDQRVRERDRGGYYDRDGRWCPDDRGNDSGRYDERYRDRDDRWDDRDRDRDRDWNRDRDDRDDRDRDDNDDRWDD